MNGTEPLLKDISVTLNPDTPEWPGDTPFTCGWSSLMGAGASVNVSLFTSSPHVGTHADAPLHVREGWSGSHELSLDAYFGPAIIAWQLTAQYVYWVGPLIGATLAGLFWKHLLLPKER